MARRAHALLEPLDAALEQRRFREQLVLHAAVAIAAWVFGAPAELAAEEDIVDAGLPQRVVQRLAIELRIVAAVGRRAYVGAADCRDMILEGKCSDKPKCSPEGCTCKKK